MPEVCVSSQAGRIPGGRQDKKKKKKVDRRPGPRSAYDSLWVGAL